MVHIPLPGWAWNLERRKQWHAALDLWRKIDNIVILVELPPASVPEAVLLAENIPNLIWLTDSDRSDAMETRTHLETLRHARGNLVGAVLNRAPSMILSGRFARWFGCWAVFAALSLSTPGLLAQEDAPPYIKIDSRQDARPPATSPAPKPAAAASSTPTTPVTSAASVETKQDAPPPRSAFSVGASAQRAQWQQRLTLGPGDLLNLSLFGSPELAREEVPVGPDGRISFLEAQNVLAAGLTIDELRQRLGEELGKFRRSAQPMIQPAAYRSKKYFVLGKVVQKGAFTLDRPITVIEAVARARGLETGLADRNLVELTDLSRSFLARGGRHLPVNFEKLFLEGDLTQNVPLEPDDYLYFPAGELKEIYVLGEVMQPGANVFSEGAGALAAIAARGGFTERAWKKRLLVIRGSLNNPETFVVNAHDVLSAKAADFKLQPKDIVYVSSRPWIRAEELLDIAATAFVEAAVVTWVGVDVYSNK
jgi:protein involved in polysaccharide export with SLBB domain